MQRVAISYEKIPTAAWKKLFSAGINESEVRNFRAEDSHRL
jgi:hypothetical protein